jgi:hypothetical protein
MQYDLSNDALQRAKYMNQPAAISIVYDVAVNTIRNTAARRPKVARSGQLDQAFPAFEGSLDDFQTFPHVCSTVQ